MDIAKYIGLYLQKNKYCCLQGLGNLEIKKVPAKRVGEEVLAPTYTAHLQPVGSIDDAFPNFVANNEHVSIAKATNEISDFIKRAKAILAEGGRVNIPAVGDYVLLGQRLQFELDPSFVFQEKPIHFPKIADAKPLGENSEAEGDNTLSSFGNYDNYNHYNNKNKLNWNLIAFWGVVVIIGGSIITWAINYFVTQQNSNIEMVEVKPSSAPIIIPEVPVDTAIVDSAVVIATNAVPVSTTDSVDFKFLLQTYNSLERAEKRAKQLAGFGYSATSVVTKDTATYYVVSTIKMLAADTTKVKDSLAKNLNPKDGVSILR